MADDKKEPGVGRTVIEKLRSLFAPRSPRKKKDGLPPKAHFSIWYFVITMLLIIVLQQYFLSPNVETIPYSQFKEDLAQGSVEKLTIGPENITGTLKGQGQEAGAGSSLPFGWTTPISSKSWMTIRSATPGTTRANF